jgi:hypothetical protein
LDAVEDEPHDIRLSSLRVFFTFYIASIFCLEFSESFDGYLDVVLCVLFAKTKKLL